MRKNYFLLILLFIGITTTLNAQIWTQKGSDIDGEAADDYSGWSVDLSADGSIMAIGAMWNDGNGANSGHVRIYQNVSGIWTQIGADINGEAEYDEFGTSVSLNDEGSIVAIGAAWNDGNGSASGHVRIYQNISGTWTKIGSDIDGEATDDRSGSSISLSSNGSVVAIGAWGNDGSGSYAGHVRVYENISGTWTKIGADIDGEAAEDGSGGSVSLSSDGSKVAIGAPNNDGNGSNSGHVRIYQNVAGTWTQIGADIDGEAAGDNSGISVSLSSDGSVVAIGEEANNGNGTDAGQVRIYKNITGTWTQIGADIEGEAEEDYFGSSVSLSSDGSVVAIGAPYNDGNGASSGHVRVFKNISGSWMQIGTDIDGEAAGDYSGGSQYTSTHGSVSINSDGSIVAIGAPKNDGNGANSGHVRVYELEAPVITSQPDDQEDICPGDDVNFLVVAENVDSYQWQRSLDGGSEWIDISNTSIYSGTETNTLTVATVSGLNNYQFRCVVGVVTMVESDAATLSFETENPTISCVANQERDKNSSGTYTVAGTEFDPASTDDNCDIESIINEFNSAASFDVTVEDATGINDLKELGISIYPNPTNGMLKLDFAGNQVQKLKVSDNTGKTVFEKTNVQQNETINLAGFANGIYIIILETENGISSSKIIKE